MVKLRYIFSNITPVNLFLTAAVILFFNYLIYFVYTFPNFYVLRTGEKPQAPKEKKGVEPASLLPADYIMISEENLFHPERKIPAEKKAEEQQQQLPKPEFVLYGTLISDNISLAYIEDMKAPRNTPGRGKRQTTLKKGDTLSGFILKEIDVDKVVMARGDEKLTIQVHNTQRLKGRESIVTSATAPKVPFTSPPPALARPQGQKLAQPQIPVSILPKQPEHIVLPPQNAEETAIINFIEKSKHNR